jgi:hypothetical protein
VDGQSLVNVAADSCDGDSGGGGGSYGGVEDVNGFVDELDVVGSRAPALNVSMRLIAPTR